MRYVVIVIVLFSVAAVAGLPGCGDSSDTDVTTLNRAREDAATQITPQNADAELEKLKKEIAADTE